MMQDHNHAASLGRAELKALRRAAKAKPPTPRTHIDCACVIHGTGYDWVYVDRLYNMVSRHLHLPVRFHVYTERDRAVPGHMIRHDLREWPGITGPKRSWWYKMQLFNSELFSGDLLYFDLDTVIVRDISWCVENPATDFWTLRDFRYLQKPTYQGINSSVMWFNTEQYYWVWQEFQSHPVAQITSAYPGDQDYLFATIPQPRRRLFEDRRVASYRWQLHDGGWDFQRRRHLQPGIGTHIPETVSVVVFHGRPKPHQLRDAIIAEHWQ